MDASRHLPMSRLPCKADVKILLLRGLCFWLSMPSKSSKCALLTSVEHGQLLMQFSECRVHR